MDELRAAYDEIQKEIRQQFESDVFLFGKYYFAHHFRAKTPPFHLKIISEVQKFQFFACAAPRGSAKSTFLAFLYPSHCIFFKRKHHIIIIGSTADKACAILANIKTEINSNDKLKGDFKLNIVKDREDDTVFEHPDGFKVRVVCFGRDQMGKVRGEKFEAYRPDLILIDDLEDDVMVRNPDRRRELKEIYDQSVVPAIFTPGPEYKNHQIVIIGTIFHDDSLMSKFVSPEYYKNYRKLKFQGRFEVGEEKKSIWPEWKTVAALDKWEQDDPEGFAKECQNDPVSGMMSQIKREDFRYYYIREGSACLMDGEYVKHKFNLKDCKAAIACDLAWEEKRTSDFSVIMPAFLTPNNDILVYEYLCKKGLRPNEIYEVLFNMETKLRSMTGSSVPIGFEKAKLEKVIKHLLKQEMRNRNHWLIFKDLAWDKDKNERMLTRLQPRYSQHSIYHMRNMGELENQLIRIPHGIHDDLPDAEQGLVQLLEYPKAARKADAKNNHFEWLRKKAIEARCPNKKKYVFGNKKKGLQIPALESFY
jgi:hypothetical protein